MTNPRVFILMYHTVDDDFPTGTPVEQFRREIRFLASRCYPVRLEEIVAGVRQGTALRDLSVAVTFDDGFQSVYTAALPILQEYQVPCSLFVTTGFVDAHVMSYPSHMPQRPGVSRAELQRLAASGMVEIGGHTATHPRDLLGLSEERLRVELAVARQQLQDWTGQRVQHFAYPYSAHHPALEPLLERVGYQAAVGGRPWPVTRSSNPFNLPRVGTRRGATVLEFKLRLSIGFSLRARALELLGTKPWQK